MAVLNLGYIITVPIRGKQDQRNCRLITENEAAQAAWMFRHPGSTLAQTKAAPLTPALGGARISARPARGGHSLGPPVPCTCLAAHIGKAEMASFQNKRYLYYDIGKTTSH